MFLGQAGRLLFVGTAAGLLAAYLCRGLVATFLFGVEPTDPLVLTAAVAVLAAVTLAAAGLPARRAAKLDPVQALR
jgi:ABC-type antimicrobial peptide transport system permease subunit